MKVSFIKIIFITLFLLLLVGMIVFFVITRKSNKLSENGGTVVHEFTQEEINLALEKLTPKNSVSGLSAKEEKIALKKLTIPVK